MGIECFCNSVSGDGPVFVGVFGLGGKLGEELAWGDFADEGAGVG